MVLCVPGLKHFRLLYNTCSLFFNFLSQKLVERTRQRREMLNQKLGKTPDPAPRKRVLEDTANLQPKPPLLEDGKARKKKYL